MKSFFVICLAYYFCLSATRISGSNPDNELQKEHGSEEKVGRSILGNDLNDQKETKILESNEAEPIFDSDDNNLQINERAMGMLRLGKRRPFSGKKLTAQQHQQLYPNRLSNEDEKRAMGMLRLGRGNEFKDEEEKRAMGMLRLGRAYEDAEDSDQIQDKRAMGMLRLGRSHASDEVSEDANEKRAMGMLRLGRAIRRQKRDAMAAAAAAE